MERTVPSLKDLHKEISGGSDLGALSLLRFTMQILQRWVPCRSSRFSKQNMLAFRVQQGLCFVVFVYYRFHTTVVNCVLFDFFYLGKYLISFTI